MIKKENDSYFLTDEGRKKLMKFVKTWERK
jgi:hypothetical protein